MSVAAENFVIEVLNEMFKNLNPVDYSKFNIHLKGEEVSLLSLEQQYPQLGLTYIDGKACVSTLSIIATITDILIGKRLSFKIDEKGKIIGVQWYEDRI